MKTTLQRAGLWALLGCVGLAWPAEAQIEIPAQVITNTIGTSRTAFTYGADDVAPLQSLIMASGTNQTWDFTGATFSEPDTALFQSLLLPADVAGSGDPAFANATFAEMVSGMEDGEEVAGVFFRAVTNNQLLNFGSAVFGENDQGMQDTLIVAFTPPSVEAVFPIAFESAWRDSSGATLDGVAQELYTITETSVDGWGTLITPAGSANALRLNIHEQTYVGSPPILFAESFALDFITEAPGNMSAFLLLDGDPDGSGKNRVEIEGAGYNVIEGGTNTAVEDESFGLPEGFALSQNYPNPFNPSTLIRYEIGEETNVRLNIYTLTGQLVETLVDARQPQGPYEVSFDAASLASGFYLYRLETGRGTATRLMSVVK